MLYNNKDGRNRDLYNFIYGNYRFAVLKKRGRIEK